MDYDKLKETCEDLQKALMSENGGRVEEYVSTEDMERNAEWYALKFALDAFKERMF